MENGITSTGFKGYTKTQINNTILTNIQVYQRIHVTKTIKIDEAPETLRHCCPAGGITFLPRHSMKAPYRGMMVDVYYYYCTICGSVYICNNF